MTDAGSQLGKPIGRDSPNDDGAEQRQGQNGDPEVHPDSVCARVFRQNEKIDDEPHTNRETQCDPNEIARGLEHGPNIFDLRAGDARGQYDQDNQKTRSNSHSSEPDAGRWPGVGLSSCNRVQIYIGVHRTIHHQLLKKLSLIAVQQQAFILRGNKGQQSLPSSTP
jgi:hypothetical protein